MENGCNDLKNFSSLCSHCIISGYAHNTAFKVVVLYLGWGQIHNVINGP